jgi:Rieske Fe-S protein
MTAAIDRRGFVSRCAALCGSAVLAGCASMVTHPVPVSAGRVRIRLSDHPELSRANGAIKVLPAGQTEPVYILATEDGFNAVSPICTHRGCTVDVNGPRLVCPCHGSTYDRDGGVLKGPAQRPLHRYPLTRTGDELVLEVSA